MEHRMEMTWLLDFYGPMLSLRQRELMTMVCDEDMSLSEIALQEGVTRQAVHDAVSKAQLKLNRAEADLGLVKRYLALRRAAVECLYHLRRVTPEPDSKEAYEAAIAKLIEIQHIEGV